MCFPGSEHTDPGHPELVRELASPPGTRPHPPPMVVRNEALGKAPLGLVLEGGLD